MKKVSKVMFDCNGFSAPAYGCDKPGDNSGTYVKSTDYDELTRERDELAAQVERLLGVLGNSYSALDNYCPELSELIDEVGSALTETPAQSLEAVKREWKESIDSAIEGFAFTTSEGQWVVHRDDVSGLLSK